MTNQQQHSEVFLLLILNLAIQISTLKAVDMIIKGGVDDTRLEAKDAKKIRGQGQGPRTQMQVFS